MTLTLQQAKSKQTLRAGIIARLKSAHGAIHAKAFSEEARAELPELAAMGLIMSLPGQMYTVIQPGKGRKRVTQGRERRW